MTGLTAPLMTGALWGNKRREAFQMASRINRAIELLEQGQAIYYDGAHSGHVLTYEQGRQDAGTWADYINVGMEHGAFDMTGLAAYMQGLVDGGPTRSGHRTPPVIVEAPVSGTDEANIRYNAWQFRQILGRGVHGILLCQAETADAVRAFVQACRYPHQRAGVDPNIPRPEDRMSGAHRAPRGAHGMLSIGSRGRGSETTAAPVWGLSAEEYMQRCDPWPLNPQGELLLGVKLESPEGIANANAICAVPGLAFAEMGPGDLSLSLGSVELLRDPYPPVMQGARDKVFAACRRYGIAFLEGCTTGNIVARLDEGVRVIGGHSAEMARIGRAHQERRMPV
jgi:2-keto-3-deoxy-L-rhamnonate aldolase RhmA